MGKTRGYNQAGKPAVDTPQPRISVRTLLNETIPRAALNPAAPLLAL